MIFVLPDDILVYKFLYNVSISDSNENPVRAIIRDLHHASMKEQIKKIFGDLSPSTSSNKSKSFQESNTQVMVEPTDELAFEVVHQESPSSVNYGISQKFER